jgi:REP element-mobilizing transposase RayT
VLAGWPEIAALVEAALLHFDGQRYRMLAWCLMPNHAHAVVEMMDGHSLSDIVGGWKSFTAHKANEQLGRAGRFWHADYFDRFMRNEEHLSQTIEYVEQNPVKAGLVGRASDWAWSSARPRSEA